MSCAMRFDDVPMRNERIFFSSAHVFQTHASFELASSFRIVFFIFVVAQNRFAMVWISTLFLWFTFESVNAMNEWRHELTVKSTDKSVPSNRITLHWIKFLFDTIRCGFIWLAVFWCCWPSVVATRFSPALVFRPLRLLKKRSIFLCFVHIKFVAKLNWWKSRRGFVRVKSRISSCRTRTIAQFSVNQICFNCLVSIVELPSHRK